MARWRFTGLIYRKMPVIELPSSKVAGVELAVHFNVNSILYVFSKLLQNIPEHLS